MNWTKWKWRYACALHTHTAHQSTSMQSVVKFAYRKTPQGLRKSSPYRIHVYPPLEWKVLCCYSSLHLFKPFSSNAFGTLKTRQIYQKLFIFSYFMHPFIAKKEQYAVSSAWQTSGAWEIFYRLLSSCDVNVEENACCYCKYLSYDRGLLLAFQNHNHSSNFTIHLWGNQIKRSTTDSVGLLSFLVKLNWIQRAYLGRYKSYWTLFKCTPPPSPHYNVSIIVSAFNIWGGTQFPTELRGGLKGI